MALKTKAWDKQGAGSEESKVTQSRSTKSAGNESPGEREIWLNPELAGKDKTADLDSEDPPTLYYLKRVLELPDVAQVYVEKRLDGGLKLWAVLDERDYEAMEVIYDIEEDTLDRFPMADLNFRVTVFTEGGPSISADAKRVYDAT